LSGDKESWRHALEAAESIVEDSHKMFNALTDVGCQSVRTIANSRFIRA
jgi:glutamate/tyrosine decarboxylase-like PLP-dependent enzyme